MTWVGVLLLAVASALLILASGAWFDYRQEKWTRLRRSALIEFALLIVGSAWAAGGAILILRS